MVGTLALDDPIVILGCGCFGTSTAYYLLKEGYTNVTILDRSSTLPAPDAASNDLNRIVRSSYADKFYAELAREAISLWKDRGKWDDTYHQSGVVVLGFSDSSPGGKSDATELRGDAVQIAHSYAGEAYANDVALGADLSVLATSEAIRSVFPPSSRTSSFGGRSGYLNRDGGWANAGKGLKMMIDKVVQLGGHVLPGKDAKQLLRDGGRVTGVLCADGSKHDAELVVIATGSWTPSAFPDIDVGRACLATGQCVAMIQLSPEEAARYKECPVVLDFKSGFYIFPPNEDDIIKMAIHSVGYTHTLNGVSTPRTSSSNPSNGLAVPKSDILALRACLRDVYPELSEKPFSGTRLCWYNDSPDGDWVISRYPGDSNVVLATAGSGHAYKFLPVIGRIVAGLIEWKLNPSLVSKFAADRTTGGKDTSRSGQRQELDLDQLCKSGDLCI